ncbi:MAG: 6-pyruvoyl-tetrahydropterin synthase-related protein [Anaerolineae bacterium]|nr:6-pyruvoyl-tetrahydropterin synthase-related protein [Anaerolineae bacterium]
MWPNSRRSASRTEWPLVVALLLCVLAGWPLLASWGLVETRAGGDSPFLLVRVHQLAAALKEGVFPVRWMGDAAYGYGYPFFNFYASLPYYLAALLKFLGFTYVNAIKGTQLLGLVVAGLGAYLLAKRLWPNPWGALLASAAYTFAPFHLVNLYVRGDSLSEFWAFAFYPFVLLTVLDLWGAPSLRRMAAAALAFGGLVMTHNVSALIFSPFVGLFLVYLWLAGRGHRLRRFAVVVAALALGLAVSAWFWFPALAERNWVHLEVQTTGYFFYGEHFRAGNLVQRTPLFDYRVDAAGTPFAMGLVQAILAAAGALWMILVGAQHAAPLRHRAASMQQHAAPRPCVDGAGLWALAFLLIATAFITPLSRPLWARIPLLPFAQFPWRFLSVQALAAALVIGRLADVRPTRAWIAQGAALLLAVSAAVSIQPTYLYISDADVTPQRLILYEAFTGNVGSTVRAEYLPQAASPRPYAGEALWSDGMPLPRVLDGDATVVPTGEKQSVVQRWHVGVRSPEARLVFPTLYYPGWRAFVDGREVPCGPQPGWGAIAVSVPQGSHEIVLRFGRTGRRLAAELVSLVVLAVSAGAAAWKLRRRAWARVGLGVAAGLVLTALVGLASTAASPRYAADDLTMDWAAGPYLSHNPGGVLYEGGVRLLRYHLSAERLAPGDALTVVLEWNAAANGLQAEVSLEGLAAPLFGVPDVLATTTVPIADGQSQHAMRIPPTLPPGAYLLRVRLLAGGAELTPLDERGNRIGQTYLAPVRVSGGAQVPATASLHLPFGPDVVLRDAQATQRGPGRLAVALAWETSRQLPQNYAVSVRLLDSAGTTLVQHDSQPNYGFSPTALWAPGEPVLDRHYWDLPPGLSTDDEYALQIVLYDANTLAALGAAIVPGVRLSLLDVRETYPIVAEVGAGWALSAFWMEKSEAWQGERIAVRATWAALSAPAQAYTVRVQLRDAAGQGVWETRAPLNEGSLPANALVGRRYAVDVPLHLARGAYSLAFVLEDASGQAVGAYVHPEAITIRERERTFTVPAMARRVDVNFGEEIALLGYDLRREGAALHLTLHWQAQVRPAADRTVFVHLFDPATERIAAQVDSPPRGGAYPTSQWAPGEVVSDGVVLSLAGVPAGSYRLAVGLYGPGDAPRLSARLPDGTWLPLDRCVLGEEIVVR